MKEKKTNGIEQREVNNKESKIVDNVFACVNREAKIELYATEYDIH